METENPYVEQAERRRYESDRLRELQAELMVESARNQGYANRVRALGGPRAPTQVYRASEIAPQEVLVAQPLELEGRLDPVA